MKFQGRRYKDGEVIYSDWFSRGGDNALVLGEKVDAQTTGTITVTFSFYTKNSDETGDGALVLDATASAFELILSSADTGVSETVVVSGDGTTGGGFEEMVRIKATVSGSSTDDWLLGRLFPFVWFEQAIPMTAP